MFYVKAVGYYSVSKFYKENILTMSVCVTIVLIMQYVSVTYDTVLRLYSQYI